VCAADEQFCGVSKLQYKGTMKNPTEPHQYNKMPKSGGNSVRYVVQLTNDTTSFVQDEPFAWVCCLARQGEASFYSEELGGRRMM